MSKLGRAFELRHLVPINILFNNFILTKKKNSCKCFFVKTFYKISINSAKIFLLVIITTISSLALVSP